ncbi:MAG: hypothetical protein SVY15_00360 [Halobacteriota archaeon]|nr:hypothetical protein [Halobacteriota archaeon]
MLEKDKNVLENVNSSTHAEEILGLLS